MTSHQPPREIALKRITELATSIAQPLALSVLEVRLSQQGQRRSLEVCIFRNNGEAIGLGDCEQVSRALERVLEQEGQNSGPLLQGTFLLEVVSPGIERQLTTAREFELFSGRQIKVITKENIGELGNEFVCILLGGDHIHLEVSGAEKLSKLAGKMSKSKGTKKKDGERLPAQPEYSNGKPFRLELERVFKVNLYAGDLKNERRAVVH